MDEVKIWAVEDASNVVPLASKGQTESEWLLEETLVKNPELLIPGLRLVGRQTPTEGGPLDLLGVDENGRLVVFELKRGTLSREAVAQIIDYASDLDSKNDAALAEHIAAHSGVGGIESIEDFEEWYGENTGAESLDSLRPLRLFLIGLGADDRTERMVRFLARGMDISLLTFHGFAYDGKTLLARQVEVEAAADPGPRRARRYLTAAETRARLESRKEECGVSDLFDSVSDMFQETWQRLRTNVNAGSLRLNLPADTVSGILAYARIAPSLGRVEMIFYGSALALCPDEFDEAKQAIQHETWGSEKWPELVFSLDAAGWGTHKEQLYALTRAVYEAWESQDHEEDSA